MDPIIQILIEINEGRTSFKPVSNSKEDMDDFQSVAKLLQYINEQGYLDSFNIHRENVSGNRWYDLAMTTGLSYKGEQFLSVDSEEKQPNSSSQSEDIIELHPNIAGIGINLNAFWRWCTNGKA